MKIFRQSHWFSCRVTGIILATALFVPGLFAQQPAPAVAAPVQTAGATVTLPAGWNILSQDANPSNTPNTGTRTPATDPQLVNLLFTAAPADAKRNITMSLFRYRFPEYGALAPEGTGPGIDWESAKMEQAVLMQGYTPASAQVIKAISTQNKPLITIEITAKNQAGDVRVFTDTSVAANGQVRNTNSYRLYISRPAADVNGAQEIASIIKSLNIPGDDPVPAIAQNPPPNGAAAQSPAAGLPQAPGAQATPVGNNSVSSLAGAAPVSPQAAQIVQDYHAALIMVEGDKGVGSGFLCKMDGRTYIVTNAHVLSDNSGIKLTNLNGTAFTAGGSAVAVEHDIVKLEVPATAASKAFEVMTDLQNNAKIGDEVMVPGNAEGAQVVRPVEGKIVGIGPNLIEVDAPFVKGNSGSPIIHVASGKVVGVATYLTQRKVGQDTETGKIIVETRRFGYRIDSVKTWQPIDWKIFYAESAQVAAIEELSEDFITMFNDIEHDGISAENYKSPTMSRAVRSFLQAKGLLSTNASTQDKEQLLRGFFADLRSAAHSDIAIFDSRPAYDYFRRDVDDQSRFRDDLYDTFTKAMESTRDSGLDQNRRPAQRQGAPLQRTQP